VNARDQQRPHGRVPRLAVVVVAIATVCLSVVLVTLAWRSSERSSAAGPTAAADGESAAEVATDEAETFTRCTDCHEDLDSIFKAGLVPDLLYRHKKHFAIGVSDCAMCHVANTHEPGKSNKPTMTRCFICHGMAKQAMAAGECITCHPADFPLLPTSHEDPVFQTDHGKTAVQDPLLCRSCHKPATCSECHGIEMPHPEGWKDKAHARKFFIAGMDTCTKCHERAPEAVDECDTCHHPDQPKGTPWVESHPDVVKARGGNACFSCHDPATCAACHVRGEEDFSLDEANLATHDADAAAEE